MVNSVGTTEYSHDAAQRIGTMTPPAESAVSYTWNNDGTLAARGNETLGWDAAQRLVSVSGSGTSATFSYNGDGIRDSFTIDSTTTTFTWDMNRRIPEVLDDTTYKFLYGVGRISQIKNMESKYYLTDGLGSTIALTDETGEVLQAYSYDAFGNMTSSIGDNSNTFTFAGEQLDPTGLQYLRERYYDPDTGRFISKDPLAGMTANPQGQNRYIYGLNSPCNFRDPTGLASESVLYCHAVFRPFGFGDKLPFTEDPLFTLDASVVFIDGNPVAVRASFESHEVTFGPDIGIVDIDLSVKNDWEAISLEKGLGNSSATVSLHARGASFETHILVDITFSAGGDISILARAYGEDFSIAYQFLKLTDPYQYEFCSN